MQKLFLFLKSYLNDLQKKGGILPVLQTPDPVERCIEFVPSRTPYDPRNMLAGRKGMNSIIMLENVWL